MLGQASSAPGLAPTHGGMTSGRSARAMRLLEIVDYKRIETDAEKDAVLRLRYDSYSRADIIAPNDRRRLIDRFDAADIGTSIGAYIDGNLASSIRIHVLSKEQPESPAFDAFPDILEPEVKAGKIIIDPNRFAADYAAARSFPELPYITLRLFHMAAVFFGGDIVTATIRLNHQAFYKRVFGFRTVCRPRTYPQINGAATIMFLDFNAERDRILQRHPYFRSSPMERELLFGDNRTYVAPRAHGQPALAELGRAA